MVNNDKVIFVVIYHCVVCHFCRYLPLCCLSFLSLFFIVVSVIFVVIYHCVVGHFCRYLPLCCMSFLSLLTIVVSEMTDTTMKNNDKNDRQHNGK
jgi:VanZ family protein